MFDETGMPMSQGTSHLKDPVTTLAPAVSGELPMTDPTEPSYHLLPVYSIADSLSADPIDWIDHTQFTNPQLTSDLPTSPIPSWNTSTPSREPSNPPSTNPKLLSSHSLRGAEQEPNESTGRNSEAEVKAKNFHEIVAAGEREMGERLTTLYVDSEDHPAYKELEAKIYRSKNDEDRWKACTAFHEKYKALKEPILELGSEIERQRQRLDDKESSLDALILLGTSIMLSNCDRFRQVQRSYSEDRCKRSRNHYTTMQCEVYAAGEAWSDFLDAHSNASQELQQCEKALEFIGATWGKDKIRYYGWATKTSAVCRQLKAAAKAVPNWEEAGIKLNRMRNYCDRNPGTPIAYGKSSISWKDFECLSRWKGKVDFEMPLVKRRTGTDRILARG
ncbi:hypothetical protein NW762_003633 [Fusarium torreyae]|uniref:Uncharacterized protein n=1 Tax=Fusarium torreyae TaxID=1237075 RepID=A0A9W8SAE8_9HYPO|nr:hypothetical protein NW762_003633 [Fusarium torreyae]